MKPSLLAPVAVLLAACGVPQSQYDAAVADAQRERTECDAKLGEMQKKSDELAGRQAASEEATRLELEELREQKAAAEARLRLFEELVSKFKKMVDAGKLDITVRRGQIVLALATDVLFDTGQTEIEPDGVTTLADVADALKGVRGRRFQIAGHTDNLPIKTKEFPSNWELSTARAVAVVKLLVEKGVRPDVLSAAGHAEFDPVQGNGSERGRQKNRRIEIVLVPNVEDLVKMGKLGEGKKEDAGGEAPPPGAKPPAKPKAGRAKPRR